MGSKEDYLAYLETDTWKIIRAQRLAIDNSECVLCGEKADHVHHRRYPKRLGSETVLDLVSLCSNCHERHHGKTGNRFMKKDTSAIELSDVILKEISNNKLKEAFERNGNPWFKELDQEPSEELDDYYTSRHIELVGVYRRDQNEENLKECQKAGKEHIDYLIRRNNFIKENRNV
jgi:hypothetical protein